MRTALLLLLAPLAAGCEIAPVVTTPDPPSTRYVDCERAADDYCEHVVEPRDRDMDRCVAEYKYKCVAQGHDTR